MDAVLGHLIAGEWKILGCGVPIVRKSPVDERTVYRGYGFPIDSIPSLIQNATVAQKAWQKISPDTRLHFFQMLEQTLTEMRDRFVTCLMYEVGKTAWEAHQEVDFCISKIAHTVESSEKTRRQLLIATEKKELVVIQKPLGVCLVLSPFNFPLHLALGQIIPLLMAANSVILKPSDLTPLSGQLLSEALSKAIEHVEPKIASPFQMVQGGKELGQALVENSDIRGVFFTGSDRVGREIASHTIPGRMVALEMGGNNPLVIHSYDDLEEALMIILLSAYLTAGQRCTAARRLILVESPENRALVQALQKKIGRLPYGPPKKEPELFMGPLISKEAKEKLVTKFQSLVQLGGKALIPPQSEEILSRFPSPCYLNPLLIDVTGIDFPDEEDFGPLLKLIWVSSLQEAIHEANKTRFGLCASIISRDEREFQTFFEEVAAGVINWNCPTTGSSGKAPFGGVGASGNFRPAGASMIESCCYPVSSTRDRSAAFLEAIPEQIRLDYLVEHEEAKYNS